MSFNFWWMNHQFDVQKDPEVYKLRLQGGWLPGIVYLHPQGLQHSFDLLYWVCKLCAMVKRILTEDEIAGDNTYTDRLPKFKGSLRILCRQAHAGECSCFGNSQQQLPCIFSLPFQFASFSCLIMFSKFSFDDDPYNHSSFNQRMMKVLMNSSILSE
jgi:hypothetical protein